MINQYSYFKICIFALLLLGICLSSDTTEKSQEDLKREAAERKRKEILNGLGIK